MRGGLFRAWCVLFDLGFRHIIVRYHHASGEQLTGQVDNFVTDIAPRV